MDVSNNEIGLLPTTTPTTTNTTDPIIKHIVIAGGGISGMIAYGALRESHSLGKWNINNIESIYGTSAGAIVAAIISMKYEWKIIDDYIIKRPWQNVYKFDMFSIMNSFQNRGILNLKSIEEMFSPLFRGLDISLNISMLDFYEITKIELHLFATEINQFELVDFSYKTHPNWRVVDAIYCSTSLPILFSPTITEDKCYIDGGFLLNYPMRICMENVSNQDEILGLPKKGINISNNLKSDSSLMDYLLFIIHKLLSNIFLDDEGITVKNEIVIESPIAVSIYEIYIMISSAEERTKLIQRGVDIARATYGVAVSTEPTMTSDDNALNENPV